MKPRVIIADDHLLFIEGLKQLIANACDVIATYDNGRTLVEGALHLRPDLVLLDLTMPSLSGLEAARQIKAGAPEVKLLFVTMQLGRDYIREAFQLGAAGYISKQAGASELTSAIEAVLAGRYAFPASLATLSHVSQEIHTEENPAQFFALTPRQREVLQLVAEGNSAKKIASLLTISVKTVEFHKKQLMRELHLRNSADLIRYALEQGSI